MTEFTVSIPPPTLARIREIAAEQGRPVEDVVLRLLEAGVEMYGSAMPPERIAAHVASFGPSVPRPVIDRARLQAAVDRYKTPPGDAGG